MLAQFDKPIIEISGKRLIESLEDFKRDATEEELKTAITSLEMGFKAHLDIVVNYYLLLIKTVTFNSNK